MDSRPKLHLLKQHLHAHQHEVHYFSAHSACAQLHELESPYAMAKCMYTPTWREKTSFNVPRLLASNDAGRKDCCACPSAVSVLSLVNEGACRLSIKADSLCCSEIKGSSSSCVGLRIDGRALDTCGDRAKPPRVEAKPSYLGKLAGRLIPLPVLC